ncbi:MAG: hypothetical protein PHU85_14110, partial [Phycisphaerae bacterium]|nr:hypothetical protein [Phycisphaerae bacterium]
SNSARFPDMKLWQDRLITMLKAVTGAIDYVRQFRGGTSLEDIGAIAGPVKALLEIVAMDFSKLSNLRHFPDMKLWQDRLITMLKAVTGAIDYVRQFRGGTSLEDIGNIAAPVKALLEIVAMDFSKLANARHFPDMKTWQDRLITMLKAVAGAIDYVKGYFGETEFMDIAALADEAKALLEIVATDFSKLANQRAFPDMTTWKDRLVAMIQAVANGIKEAKSALGTDVFLDAADLADEAQALLELITLDFSKMNLARHFPNMEAWKTQFKMALRAVTQAINEAIADEGLNPILDASERSPAFKALMELIDIDFSEMALARHLPDMTAWKAQFKAIVQAVYEAVHELMSPEGISLEDLQNASSDAGPIKALLDMASTAAGVFENLRQYIRVPNLRITQFRDNVLVLIRAMVDVVDDPSLEGAIDEGKAEWADFAKRLADAFGGLLELVLKMGEQRPRQYIVQRAEEFKQDLILLIHSLLDVMGDPALQAAVIGLDTTWADNIKTLGESFKPIAEFLVEVGGYWFGGEGYWDKEGNWSSGARPRIRDFVEDVRYLLEQFNTIPANVVLAGTTHDWASIAEGYLTAITAFKELFIRLREYYHVYSSEDVTPYIGLFAANVIAVVNGLAEAGRQLADLPVFGALINNPELARRGEFTVTCRLVVEGGRAISVEHSELNSPISVSRVDQELLDFITTYVQQHLGRGAAVQAAY